MSPQSNYWVFSYHFPVLLDHLTLNHRSLWITQQLLWEVLQSWEEQLEHTHSVPECQLSTFRLADWTCIMCNYASARVMMTASYSQRSLAAQWCSQAVWDWMEHNPTLKQSFHWKNQDQGTFIVCLIMNLFLRFPVWIIKMNTKIMMELREYSRQKDSDWLMDTFSIKIYTSEEILTVDTKGTKGI